MSNKKIEITVVTPIYKAVDCLDELYTRLTTNLSKITTNYEIIMVNDACPQNSWGKIEQLSQTDNQLIGINLSRNFGQHIAIACGINHAKGEHVIVMDCDLQDNPDEIKHFYTKAKEGYDIVYGRRTDRQDTFIKKFVSRCFYWLINLLSDIKIDHRIANYSIINRKVIEAMRSMPEMHRSYYMLLHWLGFKSTTLDVKHQARHTGKSSYNVFKLFRFAINNIVSFSNKPLTLSIYFGFLMTFSSLALGSIFLIRYFVYGGEITGWTSLIVSLFFLAGIIIANIGILGLYIGKIFAESKNRPMYIISDITRL